MPRLKLDEAAEMKHRRHVHPIHKPSSAISGFRFPPEAILIAWVPRTPSASCHQAVFLDETSRPIRATESQIAGAVP